MAIVNISVMLAIFSFETMFFKSERAFGGEGACKFKGSTLMINMMISAPRRQNKTSRHTYLPNDTIVLQSNRFSNHTARSPLGHPISHINTLQTQETQI